MNILIPGFRKGHAKLRVDDADDLWVLAQVLHPGDRVRGRTIRKVKVGSEEKAAVVKRPVTVTLIVKRVEWSSQATSLRIMGTNLEELDDIPKGASHTLQVEPHDELSIMKDEWPRYDIDRLEEASRADKTPVLICVFDRETALIARMKPYGYDIVAELQGDVTKKRHPQATSGKDFFKDLGKELESQDARYNPKHLIVASPSFWKEELFKSWKAPATIQKKLVLATCYGVDESGVREVLRRPETKVALHSVRASQELEIVDKLFEGIAKGSAVTYGQSEVGKAASAGAIAELLVTDGLIAKFREEQDGRLERLMINVDKANGTVRIISSAHDAGHRLDGLGGIAAMLRYRPD